MSCYAVFLKATNKQIKVFCYDESFNSDIQKGALSVYGKLAALKNAVAFAKGQHDCGYSCTVHDFYIRDVSVFVYDTDKQNVVDNT